MGTIRKKEWERFTISKDFSTRDEYTTGDVIDPAQSFIRVLTSENTDVSTSMIDDTTIAIDGDGVLTGVLYGGNANKRYTVKFQAYISDDKKLEEQDTLIVG